VDFELLIEQIAANLRRPAGRTPDPNLAAAAGAAVPTPPFAFGAKSQQRLIFAAQLVEHCDAVGRPIAAGNIQRAPVMKNFSEQQKASSDKRSGDNPEAPKTTKALPIVKWTVAFSDCLHQAIGVCNIPLACVIRADANVPATGVQAAGRHSPFHQT
jgi:hypothetical protein